MSYTFNMVGGGGLSDSNAILTVTAPHGSDIIIKKGNIVLTPTMWVDAYNDGLDCALFSIPSSLFDSQNNWTIEATLNGITLTHNLIIDSNDKYNFIFQDIPFEYQKITYVGLPSGGNVYYDLGFIPSMSDRIYVEILLTAIANNYIIFGTTAGSNQ